MKPIWNIIIPLSVLLVSCLQMQPETNQLTNEVVLRDSLSATAVVTNIYAEMANEEHYVGAFFDDGLRLMLGMTADEWGQVYDGCISFMNNQISPQDHPIQKIWTSSYHSIYQANMILEGLTTDSDLSPEFTAQLLGEASFLRAFMYFYLTNLFGDVPLVIGTDYRVNDALPRAPQETVYQQMIADLQNAVEKLSTDNRYSPDGCARVNQWAARALLARVYLYHQDWRQAETLASAILNAEKFQLASDLSQVFRLGSQEAIWQLQPDQARYAAPEVILAGYNSMVPTATLGAQVVDVFKPSDDRWQWIAHVEVPGGDGPKDTLYYYPAKFKPQLAVDYQQYSTPLRLAEVYLIRAEARMQQNNITGAQDDLTTLRIRAGLKGSLKGVNTHAKLAELIEEERLRELFCEYGHRWLDLKRWKRADDVLGPKKPNTWQSTDVWYPIPQEEMERNPNLTQNNGY